MCPCGCGASCEEHCWEQSDWQDKDEYQKLAAINNMLRESEEKDEDG